MVERLIRNFYVAGYATDSAVGYRVVPSVHSASRALIESDFESNFRVARGAPPQQSGQQQVRGVRPRAESLWMFWVFRINLPPLVAILSFVGECAKRLGAVQLTPPAGGARAGVSNCGFTDVIENMERESGLRTLASSLGKWAMFCFQ